jgi:hypothetical protein
MMHAAKRRKLDQPPASLNKPFRSPLPKQSRAQLQPSETPSRLKSSILSSTNNDALNVDQNPTNTCTAAQEVLDENDLRRQQSLLSIRQTQTQQSLALVESALQILANNKPDELDKLIIRWRQIAQDAADDVFSSIKERIDRMGGYAAVQRRAAEDAKAWNGENQWPPTKLNVEGKTDADVDSGLTGGIEGHDSGSNEGALDSDNKVSQGRSCQSSMHTNVHYRRSITWKSCSSR